MAEPTETYPPDNRASKVTSPGKQYVLATGARAVDRLRLLDQVFGPASRRLLITAGLASARCVIEMGCGTGLMALWMAGQVGGRGSVWAVDNSEAQVDVAAENARATGLQNISFHVAGAEDTGLQRGYFDLVYSRCLMCHLTSPGAALKEMSDVLRPRGYVGVRGL